MNFETVACCDECWFDPEKHGGALVPEGIRFPSRIVQEERRLEYCHYCGWTTYSGMYVREDTDERPAASLRVRREDAK
jgi:hypothetical protein